MKKLLFLSTFITASVFAAPNQENFHDNSPLKKRKVEYSFDRLVIALRNRASLAAITPKLSKECQQELANSAQLYKRLSLDAVIQKFGDKMLAGADQGFISKYNDVKKLRDSVKAMQQQLADLQADTNASAAQQQRLTQQIEIEQAGAALLERDLYTFKPLLFVSDACSTEFFTKQAEARNSEENKILGQYIQMIGFSEMMKENPEQHKALLQKAADFKEKNKEIIEKLEHDIEQEIKNWEQALGI